MNIIKTWEELIKLPLDSKLYRVYEGNYTQYIIMGQTSFCTGLLLINKELMNGANFHYEMNFKNSIWIEGELNDKELGLIMIEQIKESCDFKIEKLQKYRDTEIESITEFSR